ncbi:MAG TPA: hypothetical protein PKD54_13215, partial [Pirellulaceae bacterium]|nr:hypothetical protein [Pirellulaceae bacterium]
MNQPIRLRSIRRSEWTKEMDAMLEVCSDREVARKLGVAMSSIRQRRRTIGVVSNKTSKPTQPPHWTAKADRRLGTMPDSALARELGTTKYHVRTRRLQLGIPAFVPPDVPPAVLEKPKALKLTERQLALLGTTFDTTLAKRWGVTAGTVTRLRQKLDIEAFRPVQDIEWTRGMLDLLGEVSDAELAREYELSRNTVKIKRIELGIFPYRKRRMDPEPDLPRRVTELLGKIPDKQISDRYKVNRFKLRVYRALHKIPAAEYAPPPLHRWSSQDDALLGTMSDAAVARKLGIPPPQVHHRRRLKKIPAFNRKAAVKWT